MQAVDRPEGSRRATLTATAGALLLLVCCVLLPLVTGVAGLLAFGMEVATVIAVVTAAVLVVRHLRGRNPSRPARSEPSLKGVEMQGPSLVRRIGCFADASSELPPMSPRARVARAVAGIGFLAAIAALELLDFVPADAILHWAAAIVLAWFGVSHLVASVTRYQGCPELGAIPTLVLRRPVATNCDIWHRIDRRIGADSPNAGACGCR